MIHLQTMKEEQRISSDLAKCKYKCTGKDSTGKDCDVTVTIVDGDYATCYKCGSTIYTEEGLRRKQEKDKEIFRFTLLREMGKEK